MDKNENKIEDKIKKLVNDIELQKVSGGFVGDDWNSKYALVYEDLGIKHNRHWFKKDTYYIGDQKVPKSFVYAMARLWHCGTKDDIIKYKKLISDIKDKAYPEQKDPEFFYNFLDAKFGI